MKTRLALLITMALLAVGLPIPAHAAPLFRYTISGGEATITGFNGNVTDELVIPDEITDGNETYRVTTIGDYAFYFNLLTDLDLPDSVTTIGDHAFASNFLTTLTLPSTLTTIGDYAFYGNRLAALTLPDTLTTISYGAFSENWLTDLDLPNTLTTIDSYAFALNRLSDLDLPNTLTTIDSYAFALNRLSDLDLPNTLTTIGSNAFAGSPLASVRLTGTAPLLDINTFGTNNPTVRFPWKFGIPRTAGGYTTPTWNGYTTTPVADVTFTGGGNIDAQSVDVDGAAVAAKPADPVKAGHVFTGWYAAGATTPFDFTTPITGDTDLTAGFKAVFAPTITGPATVSAKLGATVTWEPTITGDPAVTITATGLPAGLTIDPTTGAISGKVTDAALTGNHAVTLTATNGIDPAATFDLTISIEGFTSAVADGAVTITGYNGTPPTNLVIPDEISTHPVTAIGSWAFSSNQLTELTLPDTLTSIASYAFYGNRLAALTLPDALTTIDSYAFHGNQLTELTLPDTITTIGESAFGDNRLASVQLTGAAPQLGHMVFGASTRTVRFPWKFGTPRTAGGYTTPTWNYYSTIPVADVTFTGGGDIDTQSVDVDGTAVATKPADPTKAGHVFTGWFTTGATTPFNFTTPITGDTALTAGFELPTTPNAPVPTVPTSPADPAISGLDPAIVGNAREGKTLTAKPGTLTPSGTTATYQWQANGKAIKGATKSSLKLRKAQAGKRITVTITAKATGAPSASKTSDKTKPVASAKRRLVLSNYTVGKNRPITVTATGFKADQKVIIWLGGDIRYTGRADSRGVITKAVTFAKDTKAGVRRVRVSGYQAGGDRNRTIHTTVRYR